MRFSFPWQICSNGVHTVDHRLIYRIRVSLSPWTHHVHPLDTSTQALHSQDEYNFCLGFSLQILYDGPGPGQGPRSHTTIRTTCNGSKIPIPSIRCRSDQPSHICSRHIPLRRITSDSGCAKPERNRQRDLADSIRDLQLGYVRGIQRYTILGTNNSLHGPETCSLTGSNSNTKSPASRLLPNLQAAAAYTSNTCLAVRPDY